MALAYFDWPTKEYEEIPADERVEALAPAGDIAWGNDGRPAVDAHVVGGRLGRAHPGRAPDRGPRPPTLELTLVESTRHLERQHDPQTGLAMSRV
ncbi:MAG: hypothetical protein K2X87_18785 [Gemmataceae bacterium]|nr:hypothetical protein [Gemmataceae bacterium]